MLCHAEFAMSVVQLGEEVHADCVLDGRQLEQYHLDLLQVMVATGHHPRLLLDEVWTANLNTHNSNPHGKQLGALANLIFKIHHIHASPA